MTLNYHGQDIDLSGAYQVKVFNQSANLWCELVTDFSKSEPMEIFGIMVPTIPKKELIRYKKMLARDVDIADIEEIDKRKMS